MADYSFKQGESKKITFALINNGVAVDLTNFLNVKVDLYVNDTVRVKQFSVTANSGDGKCEVDLTGLVKNLVDIYIERSDSVIFPTGPMKAVVLVDMPNADFPSGSEIKTYILRPGVVIAGVSLDTVLP
jgi:hypothetical protein